MQKMNAELGIGDFTDRHARRRRSTGAIERSFSVVSFNEGSWVDLTCKANLRAGRQAFVLFLRETDEPIWEANV